jgi:hypothetical protein
VSVCATVLSHTEDFFHSKMGSVSINDIKQGRPDKTIQLLKALKGWGEKRRAVARSIGKGAGQAGPWMAMEPGAINW